jgi:hypothetical protein
VRHGSRIPVGVAGARARRTRAALRLLVPVLALTGTGIVAADGACRPATGDGPRTLVLALDGVPFRVVERARAGGAFADWPPTSRLIAPFPSVTNVAFTEMLQPTGIGPAPGYEFAYFDRERNAKLNSSPFNYRERSFAWRDEFDAIGRTLGSKLAVYTHPRRKARKELAAAAEALLASPDDLVLAHVGSTDALQHLKGDDAAVKLLLEVDRFVADLRRRHEAERGRPLRVVLLSDHGNTEGKVEGAHGFKRRLRKAGFTLSDRLEGPDHLVATTFGIVSYGALFVAPDRAERAARAVADHPAVAFCAWLAGPQELWLASREGTAIVRWRDRNGVREYAYEPRGGDPLGLHPVVEALNASGLLDGDGFAAGDDWLLHTVVGDYPDAPHRLVESLTGTHLRNHASVLFSLRPGRSWGWKSAKAGSWLRTGHLEGTHGGLDSPSSLGFFLADDAASTPRDLLVRGGDALDRYLRSDGLACGPPPRAPAGVSPGNSSVPVRAAP